MTTDAYDNPRRPNRREQQRLDADLADPPPATSRDLPVQLVRCRGCRRHKEAEAAAKRGWEVSGVRATMGGVVWGMCPECRRTAETM